MIFVVITLLVDVALIPTGAPNDTVSGVSIYAATDEADVALVVTAVVPS